MSEGVKLAEVRTLYDMGLLEVSRHLRRVADEIDRGEHGEVRSVILVRLAVIEGQRRLDTFGYGAESKPAIATCLLERAAQDTRRVAIGEDDE